jgi:uncharacterized protein YcbK (DUF882 family)
MLRALFLATVALCLCASLAAGAASSGRFFIEGDGTITLVNRKTGAGGRITYRTPGGEYPASAQRRINQIFGVPPNASEGMAIRFTALLDYLQDHFGGGTITIVSGYRSPAYNEGLRRSGGLVARTSMHLEGMAADIEITGVGGKRLWMFVRGLNCCGAGYYHARSVHVDVGPRRFWDETSTGVDQDLGARNKLILLRTEWDRYRPGEEIRLTLGRITDYPIGVRRDGQLIHAGRDIAAVRVGHSQADCVMIQNRSAARALVWKIPVSTVSVDKAQIRLSFCQPRFPEMPEGVDSNPISIR